MRCFEVKWCFSATLLCVLLFRFSTVDAEEDNLRQVGQHGSIGGGLSQLIAEINANDRQLETATQPVAAVQLETATHPIAAVQQETKQLPPTQAVAGPAVRTGMCVKETARPCRSWKKGNLVDHLTQCVSGNSGGGFLDSNPSALNVSVNEASCSADLLTGTTSGTCRCGPNFCADTDMLCHRGTYQVINDIFTISTKAWGPEEKLFMTPDGKVKIGIPHDPRAAQWRVSVTAAGVKILWTELYINTVMQEYETCTTITDTYGAAFTKCSRIVGNVADPRASEMGWHIELYGDEGGQRMGTGPETHLQLRSAHTWDMFYISPLTKEGKACESRGSNCPGDAGALLFDPPLLGRMDFFLDTSPGNLPGGLNAYVGTVSMAAILSLCLCCAFAIRNEQDGLASGNCVKELMTIPFKTCLGHLRLGQGASI